MQAITGFNSAGQDFRPLESFSAVVITCCSAPVFLLSATTIDDSSCARALSLEAHWLVVAMLVVGTCREVFLSHDNEWPLDLAESPVVSSSTELRTSRLDEGGDSSESESAHRPSLP